MLTLAQTMPELADPGPVETSPVKADDSSDFSFLPKSLTAKCRQLIETYHGINGYSCLPDMLWHVNVRGFIETRKDFAQIFKRASTIRSAKRANEGYVLIATTILALEVLGSGFANWGIRFPAAKRKADAMLVRYTINSRTYLMHKYLYPRSYISPAFIRALAPPGTLPISDRAEESRRLVDGGQNEAGDEMAPVQARRYLRELAELEAHLAHAG
jgi:hypothetical protein